MALRIAKAQKLYSVDETLVKGCIQDVCLEVLGEAAAAKDAKVPLSNDTIAPLTAGLADNMEIQLVDQIKLVKYNSIFQSDHFVLSTNFLFKFNVSLPLVTGELLQNTVDVNNVTYKLYNIKLQRLPVLLNTKNYLSTGQAIT